MRKLLWLSVMLCLCLAAAQAEENSEMPFYRLYVRTDQTERLVGSAAVVSRIETATALIAGGELPAGAEAWIEGPDGRFPVRSSYRLRVGGGLFLIVDAAAGADAENLYMADDCVPEMLIGLRPDGTWTVTEALRSRLIQQNGYPMALTAAGETLLPGAIGINSQDVAVTVLSALSGEGDNLWLGTLAETFSLALDADDYDMVTFRDGISGDEAGSYVTGFHVEASEGVLVVDWSDRVPANLPEDASWRLYIEDTASEMYSAVTWSADTVGGYVEGVPGHSYDLWLRWITDPEERGTPALPAFCAVRAELPDLGPVTRYGYRETSAYVTMAPEGRWAETDEIPQTPVTRAGLEAGEHVWLQITSVYDAAEEYSEPLVIALTDPSGECFTNMAGFLYMPGLAEDRWHSDITVMLMDALRWNEAAGRWRLEWYYGGRRAGGLEFDIVP